jgi:hypothetical protein
LAMTKGGRRTITSLEQRGILGFQPSEGVAALDLLMGRVSSQATVIRMDWSRFRKTYPIGEEPPLLACLAPDVQAPTTAETESLVAEDPATGVRARFLRSIWGRAADDVGNASPASAGDGPQTGGGRR